MNRSTPGLLSITNSRSSLRLASIESVMPSSHLILSRPLLLLSPIPPSIRVFSYESTLHMRWPKYWSFSYAPTSLSLVCPSTLPRLAVTESHSANSGLRHTAPWGCSLLSFPPGAFILSYQTVTRGQEPSRCPPVLPHSDSLARIALGKKRTRPDTLQCELLQAALSFLFKLHLTRQNS